MTSHRNIFSDQILAVIASYLDSEKQLSILPDKALIGAAGYGKRGFDRMDSLFMLCNRGKDYQTLLPLSIKGNRMKVVLYLLEKGVLLHHDHLPTALETGNSDLVFLLLRKGLKIIRNRERCIESAVLGSNLDLVNMCILHYSLTPTFNSLLIACRKNLLEIFQYLHSHSRHLNYLSLSKEASKYGSLSILRYIREKIGESYTKECLQEACQWGQKEIVNYLLFNFRDSKVLRDLPHIAIQSGKLDILEILLSKRKFDLNDLLVYACSYGKEDIVNRLLDLGAEDKDKALEAACSYQHSNIVKLYLRRGEQVPHMTRAYFRL